MYIERVVLRDIKGFAEVDLNFASDRDRHEGWCVITGDNGAGKTALLKAICLAMLGPEQGRVLVPDLSGWVREGQGRGTISVEIRPDHLIDTTAKGGQPHRTTFWAEVEVENESGAWILRDTDVFRKKKKGAVNGPWAPSTSGWFTVAYGPFRRLYGSSPDASRLMAIPGRVPRFATLFKEDATLFEGEEWLRQLHHKSLEHRALETKALENLLALVRDDFLREGVHVDRVDSDGIWLFDQAGKPMSLADMSEGYRATLAMLIDIYRHLVDAYGPDTVAEVDGRTVVPGKGVVIIDEVDAHLHPAWQREIGLWLTTHFPNIQFIVTTHSPIVCQAADDGRIYHLPGPASGEKPFRLSESDYRRVIAGKPEDILLSPAFGLAHTRSPRAVAALNRRAQLVSKQLSLGLAEAEKSELTQLDLFAAAAD